MKKVNVLMILTVAIMLLQCGCGSKEISKTYFLSDYSKLQRESDSGLRYLNDKTAPEYSAFIVDPVQIRSIPESKSEGKLTEEQIMDLTNYMHMKVVEAIEGAGLKVVYQPSPGVARIRSALTDIKKTHPINMLPQASLLAVGVGGASMEAEAVDSMTGEQIAAVVQSKQGSRIPFTNLGDWAAAKGVMDSWAARFQKTLETMHGE